MDEKANRFQHQHFWQFLPVTLKITRPEGRIPLPTVGITLVIPGAAFENIEQKLLPFQYSEWQ